MPQPSAGLILHGGRLVDAEGETGDAWLVSDGATIVAVGLGDAWRAEAAARPGIEVVDADGRWVTPGFIDLHVHGGGGHSFEHGADAIAAALAAHRAHGTTRSMISLVSNPADTLQTLVAEVADVCAADPTVLGSHLEGPFISLERCGAHDVTALRPPSLDEVERLIEVSAGTLRQVTIAPELPGALPVIERLVEAGATVAIGHTAADYGQARAAFAAGASSLTHTFNAMPPLHHRRPGPIGAAIDDPAVTLELINDGIHVGDTMVRLAFTAAPGRVALITDAMAAAGAVDGRYRLGSRDVVVADGVATLADTGTLAGSTLTLDVAVRRAVALGLSPAAAVEAVTLAPARALGLDDRLGRLRPGYAADLVILDADWTVHTVHSPPR